MTDRRFDCAAVLFDADGVLVDSDAYDLIVVDTPPTRHALDFLEAPRRIGDFLDRRIVKLMEAADHDALAALTAKELHETGSHELLNWLVLLGAVSPARARVRFFGEMGRIDLAALEWSVR